MATVTGSSDYINAHGTSTPAGDITELKAVMDAFDGTMPPMGSTKSLSGHSLGAAGVQEAIYSLLMQQAHFIAASANIDNLDPGAAGANVVTKRIDDVTLNRIMSNSFGFGGTNCTLVFQAV
jgi:3-oxoacyl-[acyl-carrier-protein] synthase-1